MKIELDINAFMQTEEGQRIAEDALLNAFNQQAAKYFNEYPKALENLSRYVVEHIIGAEITRLKEDIERQVRERLEAGVAVEYLGQNHVLKSITSNCVQDNASIIREKVIEKLSDDNEYTHISWALADALIKAIREPKP